MELDKIIPLQETPKTPYQTSIAVPILRFRWIHAQCFQFELPGGKILMTDPFFHRIQRHGRKFAHRLFTQMNLER